MSFGTEREKETNVQNCNLDQRFSYTETKLMCTNNKGGLKST